MGFHTDFPLNSLFCLGMRAERRQKPGMPRAPVATCHNGGVARTLPSLVSLVALPLGNARDLSPRAAETLQKANLLFCEDTRKFHELAQRAGLSELRAKLVSLPGDREFELNWFEYCEDVEEGQNWALVSDAGTPIVNDPGAALLKFCREQGVKTEAVPGPCAFVAAWQWSGGFGVPFSFAGFPPKVKSAASKELADFFAPARVARTFAFFDTRHQVQTTFQHLEENGWAEAQVYLAREMTKPHEELLGGTVAEMAEFLRRRLASDQGFGEVTCLLEGRGESAAGGVGLGLEDLARVRSASAKEASKIAARLTGRPARDCYQAFHSIDKKDAEKKEHET